MFVYLSILFCLYIVNLIMSSFFSSLYYYYSFIILFFFICNRQRLSCLSFSSLSLFFRSIDLPICVVLSTFFLFQSLFFILMYLKIFYTYFLHHRNPLIKKLSIFCRFKDEQKQNKHRFLIYNRKTNDLFFLRLPKYDLWQSKYGIRYPQSQKY